MPLLSVPPLSLPPRCLTIVQEIARQRTSSFRLVVRAQIWLACLAGTPLKALARSLHRDRNNIRLWRRRWEEAEPALSRAEAAEVSETDLRQLLLECLSDQPRSGAPPTFSAEQIVQLMALACEDPNLSGRPVSHWTPPELAAEAIKRGFVETISPSSVGRFLKSGRITTTSGGVLVARTGFRDSGVSGASDGGL
jgi:putative transposase